MDLIVDNKGLVRCIYDEGIHLAALGSVDIKRASHVEPTPDGQWTADLSPVAGPSLGPFTLRSEALAAEHQWLERNWLSGDSASALMCPQCGSHQLAYAEFVQRMYHRCEEEAGVLICQTASDVMNWKESKDATLCCRQCGLSFPVPPDRDIEFV